MKYKFEILEYAEKEDLVTNETFKAKLRLNCLFLFLLLMLVSVATGQNKKNRGFQYGCVEDLTIQIERIPSDAITLRCSKSDFQNITFNTTPDFSYATFDANPDFSDATFDSGVLFNRATFEKTADFHNVKFDSTANFHRVTFKNNTDFHSTIFDSTANFWGATFNSVALFYFVTFASTSDFRRVTFDGDVPFTGARFKSEANFENSNFNSIASFNNTDFASIANFFTAKFESFASFNRAIFNSEARFYNSTFNSAADFSFVRFDSTADFSFVRFDSTADFRRVKFDAAADFESASFWGDIDFLNSEFNTNSKASFARAIIRDTVRVGTWESNKVQRLDFRRVYFLQEGREIHPIDSDTVSYPGATVVLHAPVQIQLQTEKFDYLHLADNLTYFEKSDIITYIKYNSFNDNQEFERFELDYFLERSTMHQPHTGTFEEYPWYHYKLWWNYLYFYLMGFGYRPFRIFLWAAVMILLFSIYYRLNIPMQICMFVQNNGEKSKSYDQEPSVTLGKTLKPMKLEKISSSDLQRESKLLKYQDYESLRTPWIHCLYFSTMVFFTFRLKHKILIFFEDREQRIILTQWILGFLVYVAFLTLAKEGSILQQLKVLIVG